MSRYRTTTVLVMFGVGLTLALLGLGLLRKAHAAEPGIGLDLSDDRVVILIPGARAEQARPIAVGDRIELALSGTAPAVERALNDETVRRITITKAPRPYLGITLQHGRTTTRKIADALGLEETADGLRLTLPRKSALGTWKTAAKAERDTPSAKTADESATAIPVPELEGHAPTLATASIKPGAPILPDSAESSSHSAGQQPLPQVPLPQVGASSARSRTPGMPIDGAGTSDGSPRAALFWVFGLALAALGVSAWKKRKASPGGALLGARRNTFEILSQKALGGKSRIVLLRIKDRELLVGVSEGRVSLLDSWDGDAPDEGIEHAAPETLQPTGKRARAAYTRSGDKAFYATSPLVQGILKLKGERRSDLTPATFSGNTDEDREWAHALAEATQQKARIVGGNGDAPERHVA